MILQKKKEVVAKKSHTQKRRNEHCDLWQNR